MKISKLFHWLYATLMFLPVLVLPAFMIYSHRHTIDSYEVNYAQNQVVDFNQQFSPENYNARLTTSGEINVVVEQYKPKITFNVVEPNETNLYSELPLPSFISGHQYLFRFTNTNDLVTPYLYKGDTFINLNNDIIITFNNDFNYSGCIIGTMETNNIYYLNVFDLTQMFGANNEPTIQQFNSYYTKDYYEYTLSHKELLHVGSITYNDSDIGSQIIYNLYNVTNNYFNFSNFFSFNGIYDWLLINFFNGNAPLGFALFWQWLCYWVLISIFWLIFDLVMYVPKLAHKWLDKASIE